MTRISQWPSIFAGGVLTSDLDMACFDILNLDDVTLCADGTSVIGDNVKGLDKIHFAQSVAGGSGPRTDFRGIHIEDPGSDIFFGSDDIFPGYYSQKAVKVASVAADSSETASLLFQGYWGTGATPVDPVLYSQYGIGDGVTLGSFSGGEDAATYVRRGLTSIGFYDGARGGGGLIIGARLTNCPGAYLYADEANLRFTMRLLGGAKAAQRMTAFGFAGLRLTSVIPVTDAAVDLGVAANRWRDGFFSRDVQIGGALDHNGTTVGFYTIAPVARPAAYTQTYATATRTHAARTDAALTDNVAGTVGVTLAAIPDPADNPLTPDILRDDIVANILPVIRDALSSLADQHNKNRTDDLNSAQVLNQAIDDQQANGLFQ